MPAAAIIGAGVLGAGASVYAANKASKAQAKSAEQANAAQLAMFNKQVELQEPFRQGGLTAQQQIMQLLGIGGDANAADYGSLAKPFGMEQFQADPGYAFRQAEAQKALERSAAARGMLLSGSTLKGIERFSQDLASQEYANAFNRYQIERGARLNPLQSLMGSGQSATNTMTSAAGNYGQAQANNLMAAGQARASGYVGMGNAISGALSGIGNAFAMQPLYAAQTNYLNRLNTPPSGGGYLNLGSSSGASTPNNYMYGGLDPTVA